MRCADCQAENREGRRFCGHCGARLHRRCESCGFANEPGDGYCGGCGMVLAGGEDRPGVPAAPASEADRRHLTVAFCDLVGSTEICEHLDPEDVSELLTAFRNACAAVVQRFEGYIGNFMGDGLLIYFGYPQAHEDDPQRAVHAALAMIEAVDGLNAERGRPGVRLAARIGINTGLVVAGDIGTGERRERLAIVGEVPNMAARLQAVAEPGAVVIGPSTYRLVRGLFQCRSLGLKRLKGIGRPVEAFRVEGPGDARTHFEARLRDGLTPLVGRREELDILTGRWRRARDGEGQAVLINSSPGHGKSRLLESLSEIVRAAGGDVIRFHCSPYHRDVPLHPLRERLERTLAALPATAGTDPLHRLRGYLAGLGKHLEAALPAIAGVLAIPAETNDLDTEVNPVAQLSPDDRKAATFRALVHLALAYATRGPLLLLFEDLHWADVSTREYVSLLVERIPGEPVLLVCTSRPGYDVAWADRPHATKIELDRLSRRESIEMIAGVTGGLDLPEAVRDHILDRADDVPLFIEELTRSVLESPALERRGGRYELTGPIGEVAIPASLQDSLMARLDRLGSAKELAQLASVFGRSFREDLIAAVSGLSSRDLEFGLSSLIEAGLLHRRGRGRDVRYDFKHALLHDAAYESLLLTRRRALHLAIARNIETRFPDIGKRSPDILERHYREARAYAEAFPYALRAGDAAAERYARAEAAAHYASALEMAERLPAGGAGDRMRITASVKLATVATNRADFERDLANLGRAQALAEKLQDRERLCEVVYWTGRTHYVLGAFGAAAAEAETALQIAETLGKADDLVAGPTNLLARVACLQGDPQRAVKYAARSVEQMRRAGNAVEEAAISGVLAFAYAQQGCFAEGHEAADHAVQLADRLGHLPTIAACYMFRGVVHGWAGAIAPALAAFDHALEVCDRSGDRFRAYLVYGWSGEAGVIAGEYLEACRRLTLCLELGDRIGTSFHRGAFEALLMRAQLEVGNGVVDATPDPLPSYVDRLDRAIIATRESGESWALSIALRIAAEVALRGGDVNLGSAEDRVREAQAIQDQRQCRCDLAWTCLTLADVLAARGDRDAAAATYTSAGASFDRLGLTRGQTLAAEALMRLAVNGERVAQS